MNSYMRDYLMRRRMTDGRNPYGSRGGYVDSRRDRNYEQTSRRDMGSYYPFNVAGQFGRYDGHYPMPMPMMYDYRRNYNYDMAGDYGETLSKDELKTWNKKLMREIDDKENLSLQKKTYLIKHNKWASICTASMKKNWQRQL